jgi:GMP synthase (glutamine-hydrolysing)
MKYRAMKAIIIQHEDSTPPGSTLEWLELNKIDYSIRKVWLNDPLPDLEAFQILIICGGSMNVDQEDSYNWLRPEKALIKKSIDNSKMVVGLCLGSQLIAEVLGATVKRHHQTELGWHKINFFGDSPFSFQSSVDAYQWHSYTFEIPHGAVAFGTNSICTNQAFTYKKNVIAYQFHPETTEAWVIECANSEPLPVGTFCQSKSEMLESIHLQKNLQKWYFQSLDQLKANWQSHL